MRDSSNEGYRDFMVYYQPIIRVCEDNKIECAGAEALIRWKHATMGFVSPGEFIPLAEYLGLIHPIGTYILRQACKACRNWNELGHPDYKVNVNLSVVQLLQDEYAKAFIKMISEPAVALKLHVCVEGIEKRDQLEIIRKMGIEYIQGYYFDRAISLEEFEMKYIFNSGGIK